MSQFYIASLKHTSKSHEHITWWQRFSSGYTPVLGIFAEDFEAEGAAGSAEL